MARFSTCPNLNNIGSVASRMEAIIREYIDKFPNDDKSKVAKILYNTIAQERPDMIDIFTEAILEIKGIDLGLLFDSGEVVDLAYASSPLKNSIVSDGGSKSESLNESGRDEDTDFDSDDQVLRPGGYNVTESGMDPFEVAFNTAIGRKLKPEERAKLFDAASIFNDSNDFYDWVYDQFLDPLIHDSGLDTRSPNYNKNLEARKRLITVFYNTHNELNSQKFTAVKELIYTNLDGSAVIDSVESVRDAILPANDKRLVLNPQISLKDKKEQPSTVGKSFIDSLKNKIRGKSVESYTLFINLKNSGKLVAHKKDDSWSMFEDTSEFKQKDLELLEYKLANLKFNKKDAPAVLVGMRPGDNGRLISTFINPQIFNFILPKDAVIKYMKALNFSAELIEYVESYPRTMASLLKQLEKKTDNIKRKRVSREIKKEEQLELAGKEAQFEDLQKALKPFMISRLELYFKEELKKGNLNPGQEKIYVENADNAATNQVGNIKVPDYIHFAGRIAAYEWMQAVRGDNFMTIKDGSALEIMDRIKIPLSDGIVTTGMGPSEHIIYDQDRVEYYLDGERYEHLADVPGIKGKVNIFDGASFVSEEYLDETGQRIGVYKIYDDEGNIKEIKTVWHEHTRNDDGTFAGTIEKKHAEFVGIPGLEIRKKDGTVIVKMIKEMGKLRIKDGDGNYIHQISDLDAVKTITGVYDIRKKNRVFGKFRLQESSRQVIITPRPKSSDSTSGFGQILENLNFDIKDKTVAADFKKYQETLSNILFEQADRYSNLLMNATKDPKVLWEIVKYNFSDRAEAKLALRTFLGITKGKGIHLANNLTMLRPMIMNMLVVKGVLQGRTTPAKLNSLMDGGYKGSTYVMKPGRKVEEGKVILSADNATIFNDTVDKMLETFDDQGKKDFNELPYEDKVDAVNYWLEENNVAVLTYRFPLLQIVGLEPRMIQEFTKNEGNAIYHHINDTAIRLVGDNDYDKASVIVIKNEDLKIIQSFQQTNWYKERKSVNADIGIFKKPDTFSFANPIELRRSIMTLMYGSNSQGLATNLKNMASIISKKFGKIEFNDGVTITPKKMTDKVIMNYAPLNDDITKYDIPDNARLVGYDSETRKWVDWNAGLGDKYLETTAEHEFLLIANAAVDITKSGMLTAKWGAVKYEWYLDRMFHVEGKLTKHHYKMITGTKNSPGLIKNYKFSALKKAQTPNSRDRMSFKLFMHALDGVRSRKDASPEALKKVIQEGVRITNAIQLKQTDGSYKQSALSIKDIEVINESTPTEEFLLRMADKFKDSFTPQDKVEAPLVYNEKREDMSHFLARRDLARYIAQDIKDGKIDADDLEIGQDIADRFADEFYPKNEEHEGQNVEETTNEEVKEKHIINKQARFDEDLYELLDKYNNELNDAGEQVRKVFTFNMLYGFKGRANIKYLPDPIVFDNEYLIYYADQAGKYHQDTTVDYKSMADLRKKKNPTTALIQEARKACK